jgi:cell division protein FtsQ
VEELPPPVDEPPSPGDDPSEEESADDPSEEPVEKPSEERPPPVDPRLWQRRVAVLRQQGRRRLRWVLAALAALAVGVVVLVGLHSPVLAVRHVTVLGAHHTGYGLVVRAAGLDAHPPLIDVDTGAAAARVAQLPWVAHATVVRDWPDGVTVTVTERVPVATVSRPGGGVAVVDADGHITAWEPDGFPGVVALGGAGVPGRPGTVLGPAARPALVVAASLPPALASRVRLVSLGAGEELWLDLGGGVKATLGSDNDLTAKLEALSSVLAGVNLRGPAVIDVSVPDEPTMGPPRAAP